MKMILNSNANVLLR